MNTKVSDFIKKVDALAVPAMPIKADSTNYFHDSATHYYKLEFDDFCESPWIEVYFKKNKVIARISGGKIEYKTPQAAFKALRRDCRSRLIDAGITPAF